MFHRNYLSRRVNGRELLHVYTVDMSAIFAKSFRKRFAPRTLKQNSMLIHASNEAYYMH